MGEPLTFEYIEAVQGRAYQEAVAAVEAQLGEPLPRFRGMTFRAAGYQKPTGLGQSPYYRYYPGLTAKPWWERSAWPGDCQRVLARFEDEFPALREEFEAGITGVSGGFKSQQTGYFGAAERWLSYALVTEAGDPVPDAFAAFPRLASILGELVALNVPCKTYFALMRPGVHLEEHCGAQNLTLRMHLGLEIPPGDAAIKVGGIQRGWENGKTIFFDDTFVHEAWNRTGQDRYVLLMRMLHPDCSALERRAHFLIERAFQSSKAYQDIKAAILAEKAQAKAEEERAKAPPSPPRAAVPLSPLLPLASQRTTTPVLSVPFGAPRAAPAPRWATVPIGGRIRSPK